MITLELGKLYKYQDYFLLIYPTVETCIIASAVATERRSAAVVLGVEATGVTAVGTLLPASPRRILPL